MILHVNRPPDEGSLRNAGLDVVDYLTGRVVVSAERDPQLEAMSRRLAEYQTGPRLPKGAGEAEDVDGSGEDAAPAPRQRTAPHQALFDCIDSIEPFGAADILTEELAQRLVSAGDTEQLIIDVQLWCPENWNDAQLLADVVVAAVEGSGSARILDKTLQHRTGLSLLRVEAPADTVRQLAELKGVRRLDRLPRPDLDYGQSVGLGITELPPVLPPLPGAPVVAVIDSGVRSAHPLIGPAVQDIVALTPDGDGADESGHGTAVAGLALFGSLEPLLVDQLPLRPVGRLVSVRILDADGLFADPTLWEGQLLAAVELAAELGARVVNLSIADDRRPYRPDRPTPLAAALDEVVRRQRLVVVVSAGNYPLTNYPADVGAAGSYPHHLLDDQDAGLLDPATSALALSVGALCADDEQGYRMIRERVDVVPVGGQEWPSPITRRGPGASQMIKPELALPAGGATVDTLTGRLVADAGVILAEGSRADRLFRVDAGTSFAAPLAAHCALQVLAANPELNAQAVRALVLASTRPDLAADIFTEGGGPAANRNARQRLAGFGRPDAVRAASSDLHRAVLIAEESLPLDGVHLYRIPVPTTFFDSGGTRRLTVALAFSPVTRSTRRDYLASRMEFEVYRGVSLEDVAEAYVRDEPTPAGDLAFADQSGLTFDGEAEAGATEQALGPASVRARAIGLEPSSQRRSAGANQVGTVLFKRALNSSKGLDLVVAVRNVNRWSPEGVSEEYAVAVVLERDDDHRPLYAELRAQLEQQLLATVPLVAVELELGR